MSENDSSESDIEMDPEEEKVYRRQVEESDGFDVDYFRYAGIKPCPLKDENAYTYDIELFGRLGLHCYNLLHEGTNLKLMCIPKYNTNNIGVSSGDYYYITLEAIDTYNNSPCTFQTYVSEWYQTSEHGYLVVETYIARLKGPTGPHNTCIGRGWIWGWEEEAIDVYYKGKLPKWLTKDLLAAAKDEYYVVQESDILENEWLHLYAEIALYSNWKWHATRKSCEESPHLKLKANNAIFYMGFKGSGDHHPSGKHVEYQTIVRKAMDGKPGHIRLEVDSWQAIPSDLIGEDEPP
ncbi:putative protein [Arabidopsis thaliana]|uniref:UPF0725 protein At4g28920 n=2 Tax=Arabidopsis thaliana TaxID=3702 RepID=Y4289_ARATH|nr:hypothetical protein (DUF626) [Arabidopsis thaliana]Q9SV54.1 RecName: Full=UPF0725 protein At4g28920 [Arabidopsis thaliana]AEE85563.1 hypothetical protein (DUF626) [Arabidopsis thaliana]CAA0396854.1 unnamed protein product [Arabidopsis thaliana]CAB43906.1 putative protein [Arabidopsis thaliana]CAB81480.1 putative protein [Arabidopsis thaliana]CAD5329399.1 unnamed protein product [Arabidopsis thaliana]|eukprot:NP_194621.1 hypothetical protein (DUF626) [Arabidopsis thaliana]